jgi:hypothetical protein
LDGHRGESPWGLSALARHSKKQSSISPAAELLSRRHAGELIDVSEQTIDKHISQGRLKAFFVGPREQSRDPRRVTQKRRMIRVRRSDVLALLEAVPQ